jgi:hypothetical protein
MMQNPVGRFIQLVNGVITNIQHHSFIVHRLQGYVSTPLRLGHLNTS